MRRVALLAAVLLALRVCAVPVQILATGDLHDWVLPEVSKGTVHGGMAELLAWWQRAEGYAPEKFLLISCGDNFTGPAISTAYQGQPMVEAMNLMGYDVSALGNHEMDYGPARFADIRKASRFPYVCANIVTRKTEQPTDLPPFVINDEQGVKVGIVGLTTTDYVGLVADSPFKAYAYLKTLTRVVPEVRAKGAEVVIVVAHAGHEEMKRLAAQAAALKIPLIFGAHDHSLAADQVGDTWVINTGACGRSYGRVTLDVNPATRAVTVTQSLVKVSQPAPAPTDAKLKALLDAWQARSARELGVPVGYTATGLDRAALYRFVVACWLAQDPKADVALVNSGSMRQDIPAGVVTRGHILGVMPFENTLLRVTLTGAQLRDYLADPGHRGGMAGVRQDGDAWVMTSTGKPLDPAATYRVLVNSYMYAQSAPLRAADPAPAQAAAGWRDPVFAWLAAHPTSKETPVETGKF
jgi:2',3'-cyclic-nucleotide 2'-phosphodiesterase (5'-nucleotidase family)